MRSIHHVADPAADRDAVFDALTNLEGLSRWWSTRVEGDARAGGAIRFTFTPEFSPVMQVGAAARPAVVEWTCSAGHEPWRDSRFRFELTEAPAGTRLRFWQEYATELDDGAYGIYNFNWGYYLESLRRYCADGEGAPFPA